jgi:ATP-dependent RNA helicase RhlE
LNDFAQLGLSKPVLRAIDELGYPTPTPIQLQAIPIILRASDLMASAETGSGKTAAYCLPMIDCLGEHDPIPRALVIAPTRELALQVEESFTLFAKHTGLKSVAIYGGTKYDSQVKKLREGVDLVVATPGRLLDHIERGTIDVTAVEFLVLDEADRLLDMGFIPQVRELISHLYAERQTLMFSATIDERVERIASEFLMDPLTIRINTSQVEPKEISQVMHHVPEFDKDVLLLELLQKLSGESVLVFTRTRRRADWVHARLAEANVDAEPIHGDISQAQREKTLSRYRDGHFMVLVATDVAARGLDIDRITHVINYDLPDTAEDYVHRIGRTGRAGRKGVATSFVAEGQAYLVREIEKVIGRQLDPESQKRKKVPARRFGSRWG